MSITSGILDVDDIADGSKELRYWRYIYMDLEDVWDGDFPVHIDNIEDDVETRGGVM